ncbi:MAG: hypothetical protein L3K11_07085 [Thermoplasmata archaeon]|nr:hypothetical protein [Thermoplasmata archaeon]
MHGVSTSASPTSAEVLPVAVHDLGREAPRSALPFPVALALLCGALVLSIWAAFTLGNPELILVGAVVVAAFAGLYLVGYARRPLAHSRLPVAEEDFDDPVIAADRATTASTSSDADPTGPALPPTPAAGDPSPSVPPEGSGSGERVPPSGNHSEQ